MEIRDVVQVGIPGPAGTITPAAQAALAETAAAAQEARDARDQAEVFSATTVALQQTAVAGVMATPGVGQTAVTDAIAAGVAPLVPPLVAAAIADDSTVADAAAVAVATAVGDLDVIVGNVRPVADDIAFAFTAEVAGSEEKKQTWLQVSQRGGPTALSTELMLPGIDSRVQPRSSRAVAFGARDLSGGSMSPVFTDPVGGPIVTQVQATSISIFSPQLIDRWAIYGVESVPASARFMLIWSTDHAVAHSDSGVFAATAAHPASPTWTVLGRIFRDDTGGSQCETPRIHPHPTLPNTGVGFTQIKPPGGTSLAAQITRYWVVTNNGLTWTYGGIAVDARSEAVPGDVEHQGYMDVINIPGQRLGVNIGGGTNGGAQLLVSSDGLTYRGHRRLPHSGLENIVGYNPENWLVRWGANWLHWRGEICAIGAAGQSTAGTEVLLAPPRLLFAPLRGDFAGTRLPWEDITPALLGWEDLVTGRSPGRGLIFDGAYYLPFVTGGPLGSFGILEAAL